MLALWGAKQTKNFTFKAFLSSLQERCVMEDNRSVQEFQILGGTFGNF